MASGAYQRRGRRNRGLTPPARRKEARMPEQPPSGQPEPSGVPASLHAIARLLRESPPMGPEAQQALAALLDELAKALESAPLPPAEVTHLADVTAHFVQAVRPRHD